MLCERGVFSPTPLMTLGTCLMRSTAVVLLAVLANEAAANSGGDLTNSRSSAAAFLGSCAAMMALTIATPSSDLLGADDW